MRPSPYALIALVACGPMYGPSGGQQKQQGNQQQVAGPPGGGENTNTNVDPFTGNGAPSDPYANTPSDPYAEPQQPPQQPQARDPRDPWSNTTPRPQPRTDDPPPPPRPEPPPPPARPEPPPPPPKVGPQPASRLPEAGALLAAHNTYRGQHCAAPLTWSPKLEQVAQAWADSLRDQGCKFGHSGGQYGENLAAGTAGTLDGNSVSAMWYDEIKDYSFSGGGFSMTTGHFTQVVWRDSKSIGCGKATCRGMDIYVCNYDPPGNVEGEYRKNVQPKGCK